VVGGFIWKSKNPTLGKRKIERCSGVGTIKSLGVVKGSPRSSKSRRPTDRLEKKFSVQFGMKGLTLRGRPRRKMGTSDLISQKA